MTVPNETYGTMDDYGLVSHNDFLGDDLLNPFDVRTFLEQHLLPNVTSGLTGEMHPFELLLSEDMKTEIMSLGESCPKAHALRRTLGIRLSRLPCPYANHLNLQRLNLYAACLQNALLIGVPLELAQIDGLVSPFYEDTNMVEPLSRFGGTMVRRLPTTTITESSAIESRSQTYSLKPFESIKPDLRPTTVQQSHPHELYIDLIPFPIFRDRIITLLAMTPPAFDEMELKRDLHSDGLQVWGNASGKCSGVSWDKRNWECPKWFLDKWRLLVNGSGLDEQSRWWRSMRCEGE